MDINKYAAFFHDGTIIDIRHQDDDIKIYMESAEISDEALEEKIPLSIQNRIKGCLHISGVKKIEVRSKEITQKLIMSYDSGSIFELDISQSTLKLSVEWCDFPPHSKKSDFSVFKIKAEKIWWENIPDLSVP